MSLPLQPSALRKALRAAVLITVASLLYALSFVWCFDPNGIAFGMYSTEQYTAPKGDYTTVTAVDGSQWYKQYAVDTVEKTPYMAPDGSIAYNEAITKRLPDPPRRKDKI